MRTYLKSIYDSRKDFYNKAEVEVTPTGLKLYSYNTLVAEIDNNVPIVYNMQSQTTTRHVREFLLQNGFEVKNKKEIESKYYVIA